MAAGLIDADLGGSVYKKRVPLTGRGKHGVARVLVATKHADSQRDSSEGCRGPLVKEIPSRLFDDHLNMLHWDMIGIMRS
jgi:hypothetical protein